MITLPKTWDQFCKLTGRDPKKLLDVSMYEKKHQKHAVADFKLTLIIEYVNEGWIPDYTNYDEYKYFPVFIVNADKKNKSGSGLSYYGYSSWSSFTTVGVRLCFKTVALLKHVVEYFLDLYVDLHLLNK